MNQEEFPSKILEENVRHFASLPGIGRKTALRLVLHLLRKDKADVARFGKDIARLREEIVQCRICHNISDEEVCSICADKRRDEGLICVVENIQDVLALEKTGQYRGRYHVLGGLVSPMDGIGPADLTIDSLEERLKKGHIQELILALSTTMEGDTTNFYLYNRLHRYEVEITTLARGVAVGDELEYTDEITLGRSLINRTPFQTEKS